MDLHANRQAFARICPVHANVQPLVESAALSGLIAWVIYLAIGISALRHARDPLQIRELLFAGAVSLAGHLVVFLAPAGAIALVGVLGRRWRWRPGVEWLAGGVCLTVALALVIRRIALSALLMDDRYALFVSLAASIASTLFWMALMARWQASTGTDVELSLFPVSPGPDAQWGALVGSAALLGACAFVLPGRLLLADWGSVLQKSLVLIAWLAAVVLVRSLPDARRPRALLAALVATAGATSLTTAVLAASGSAAEHVATRSRDAGLALERYVTVDRSLATILDVFRPTLTDRDFYTELRTAGDVTDNRSLQAVPLRVVPELHGVPAYRPHVFVIVVDSLRPDYLAPYNPAAAAFTPSIAAFARESRVVQHAFTPYAGTALSQPAIWAGGLIPRANYVQPFAALNNLERLMTSAGYRKYVSIDEISKLTLDGQSEIRNLEPSLSHPESMEEMYKFDFCQTVGELTRQLDRDAADPRPIFMYSQPQNLHIRVLASAYPTYEGIRFGDAEFFKPAVTALRKVDACFGTFIEYLKAKRLYDDSIVILTSDHGDSYGELGRWGHAFYLMPETLRIPLIVHMPARLAPVWRENALSFSTDITPTLYELLGYGYQPSAPFVGRPLMTTTPDASSEAGGAYLVQSSYSRAFGLLDRHGAWLYVANANQVSEGYFDLTDPHAPEIALPAADRVQLRKQLLDGLRQLNAYYTRQ